MQSFEQWHSSHVLVTGPSSQPGHGSSPETMLVGNSGLVPAVNVFLRLSLRLSLVNTRLVSREFLGRDVAAEEHQESTKVRGDFRVSLIQEWSGVERFEGVRQI